MIRVSSSKLELQQSCQSATWQGDWFLVPGHRVIGRRPNWAVAAFRPDGERDVAALTELTGSGRASGHGRHHDHPDVYAFRRRIEPGRNTGRHAAGRKETDCGAAFGPRYTDPVACVEVDPLRVVEPEADLDLVFQFTHGVTDLGPVTVETLAGAGANPGGRWCSTARRKRLADAFSAVGDHGFVVFNRDTDELRPFDLGERVVRVELKPDGLAVAALLADNGVAFVDLGDD